VFVCKISLEGFVVDALSVDRHVQFRQIEVLEVEGVGRRVPIHVTVGHHTNDESFR